MLPSKINGKVKSMPDKIKDTLQKVADQYSKGNAEEVIVIYRKTSGDYGLLSTADEIETIYALEKAKIQLLVGE
jgi:hypothetical protein